MTKRTYADGVEWRPVVGYEGVYLVSDAGEIVSCKTGKTMKPYRNRTDRCPYLKVDLRMGEDTHHGKQEYVHRIVAQAFLPNPHHRQCVNHKNCNTFDNRAVNLEWCSAQYNNTYAIAWRRFKKIYMQEE